MAAIGMVLVWRLHVPPLLRALVLSINTAAVVLSFARAAWIAIVVSCVVVVLARALSRRRAVQEKAARRGRGLAIGLVGVVAVGGLMSSPQLRDDLAKRVDTLANPSQEDISGQARLRQQASLLHLAETAAPFGHGLSASGRVGVWGELNLKGVADNNVSSNWLLAMWVDGAYLALPLVLFLMYLALRTSSAISGQVLVLILVNSLWSNALFLPVTWLCIGLIFREMAWRMPISMGGSRSGSSGIRAQDKARQDEQSAFLTP
jgi:hypothetical protein